MITGLAVILVALTARADVVRMGWVPNRWMPQGQVQVRHDATCASVVVVLDSRFLDRVVAAIVEKEQRNWPADHPDTIMYLASLRAAREDVRQHTGGRGRETLAIALILDPEDPRIEWSTGPVGHDAQHHAAINGPRLLRTDRPSRAYLERNAELILEDSFGLTTGEARALLRRDDA
jgi:hypothetical protein